MALTEAETVATAVTVAVTIAAADLSYRQAHNQARTAALKPKRKAYCLSLVILYAPLQYFSWQVYLL